MKYLLCLALALVPASLVIAGTPQKGKGLVDCDNAAAKISCKECGNGGSSACCPEGWTCDVLCSKWVFNEDRTKKWCP